MLVQDIMKRAVLTVSPATTLAQALHLARERGIRHLPVVDGDRLVGIVSDRDLKRALGLSTYEDVRMGAIMTSGVRTAAPTFAVEDAARIMVTERISALPVTTEGRLVGLVTETDILALFVRALGAAEPSSRLDVDLGTGRGAFAEVVAILDACGAPISSLVRRFASGTSGCAVSRSAAASRSWTMAWYLPILTAECASISATMVCTRIGSVTRACGRLPSRRLPKPSRELTHRPRLR